MRKCGLLILCLMLSFGLLFSFPHESVSAKDVSTEYYTVYDSDNNVLFLREDQVCVGDQYISSDNKLYEVVSVDNDKLSGTADYKYNVKMPVYKITKKEDKTVSASSNKLIGLYHTHNDECYDENDGTSSVYGKGGIYDVGAKLKENFESLGINVVYDESLHLPHNSGAYTRSQATAQKLISSYDLDAIFDIHRDATPLSEYETTVNGVSMSKIRMVLGAANPNMEANKEFALSIKSYADEVYPGLIKDIYIGKGHYNQNLSDRALLFEMGTNLINKNKVLKSTEYLAKTVDVVLFGTSGASVLSTAELEMTGDDASYVEGISEEIKSTGSSLDTLWVVLSTLGFVAVLWTILFFLNSDVKFYTKRLFSELFAGIFGKKEPKDKINDIE